VHISDTQSEPRGRREAPLSSGCAVLFSMQRFQAALLLRRARCSLTLFSTGLDYFG